MPWLYIKPSVPIIHELVDGQKNNLEQPLPGGWFISVAVYKTFDDATLDFSI